MTYETIQPFLDWIIAHPTWSGIIVFLISLSESLAIVGLVVPGVVMMTAIGAMMGSGVLPFWETLLWAILGAIAGDGISYWLGYHYHEHLRDFWPFKQFPKMLARGEVFFKNHGGKSIIFGRFVGPVRPMIPVIAGMMDMPPKKFLIFNILSAIVWAPLYSLPGILIGASLDTLSPEVASRAGLFILLLLFGFWCIYEILYLIGAWTLKTLKKMLDHIWAILNRLPWIHQILKSRQGTEQGQLGLLIVLGFSLTFFAILYVDVLGYQGITTWNDPVYQFFRALYSDRIIHAMAFLTALGDPWVLLPTAAVVGIWLFWQTRHWAAFFWLLTIGTGFLASSYLKATMGIPRPEGLLHIANDMAFPSGHTITATLVYGLAAIYIRYSIIETYRWVPWLIALPLIILIAISRVYLGMHWFTDVLGALSLGFAFVALGGFMYRRVNADPIRLRGFLVPSVITLCVASLVFGFIRYPQLKKELIRQWPTHFFAQTEWWQGKNTHLSQLSRTGALKRQASNFDIQWLGSLKEIQSVLIKVGWKELPKLTFQSSILVLANDLLPTQFPVMPKFHRDRLPVLTVAKTLEKNKRIVLQLWQSDYQTDQHQTLWVGTLRLEDAYHLLPLITLYLEEPNIVNDGYTHEMLLRHPDHEKFVSDLLQDLKKTGIMHKVLFEKNENLHPVLLLGVPK